MKNPFSEDDQSKSLPYTSLREALEERGKISIAYGERILREIIALNRANGIPEKTEPDKEKTDILFKHLPEIPVGDEQESDEEKV